MKNIHIFDLIFKNFLGPDRLDENKGKCKFNVLVLSVMLHTVVGTSCSKSKYICYNL